MHSKFTASHVLSGWQVMLLFRGLERRTALLGLIPLRQLTSTGCGNEKVTRIDSCGREGGKEGRKEGRREEGFNASKWLSRSRLDIHLMY